MKPNGHAEVRESDNYEIQHRIGENLWVPSMRDLTQFQARQLLNNLGTDRYRVVRVEVLDW